jgi:hypothetical protein
VAVVVVDVIEVIAIAGAGASNKSTDTSVGTAVLLNPTSQPVI